VEQVEFHAKSVPPRQRLGDQRSLVVTAPPDAPAVERDGNHDRVRLAVLHQPIQPPCDRLGQSRPPAIFEAQRNVAGDVAIRDSGARVIEGGRIGEAGAASRLGAAIVEEGLATAGAAWRAEKIERAPAGDTEAVIGPRHRAAAGATRRQGQRQKAHGERGKKADGVHAGLSRVRRGRTSLAMPAPQDDIEIYDRALRRRRRDRAALHFADFAFVRNDIVEGLLDRLDSVKRDFRRALDLAAVDGSLGRALRARGMNVVSADSGFAFARESSGVQCDEDRLPFADGSFDLVVSAGGLDMVNDLPGALSLIRRILVPDGLFLAGLAGAGSLARLRDALLAADMAASGGVAPRLHPQIDVRAAGDLLSRAGFALPVADSETLTVRYGDPLRLIADLRGMAATNLLRRRRPPLSRAHIGALLSRFAADADADGRTAERFEILYLTGWSPAPHQPKPAPRGSGTRSLADALRPGGGPSRL